MCPHTRNGPRSGPHRAVRAHHSGCCPGHCHAWAHRSGCCPAHCRARAHRSGCCPAHCRARAHCSGCCPAHCRACCPGHGRRHGCRSVTSRGHCGRCTRAASRRSHPGTWTIRAPMPAVATANAPATRGDARTRHGLASVCAGIRCHGHRRRSEGWRVLRTVIAEHHTQCVGDHLIMLDAVHGIAYPAAPAPAAAPASTGDIFLALVLGPDELLRITAHRGNNRVS
jgi:hypothetical protein